MTKLVKQIDKANLYKEYITSLNGILKLTDREMTILLQFMAYDDEFIKNNEPRNVVSATCRKRIKEELGITPDNLSRYIKKFKDNGLIVQGPADDDIYINPILKPEIIDNKVEIAIIIKLKDDTGN